MAKTSINVKDQCRSLLSEIRSGSFRPVYVLMGEEPYYPELICQAIIDNCIDPADKDFNEVICYGADVNADRILGAARQFPMMSDRLLVVVKEAQMMKGIEDLAYYCADVNPSTVLVLLLRGARLDARKALYKAVQKVGIVVDSPVLKDYQVPDWIMSFYKEKGLQTDPQAAALLAEHAGTDLSTISLETDKLLKSLPEGTTTIKVENIEKNVGISRQFSIFELTKELSMRNAPAALKIAAHIGTTAKFAMPQAVSALHTHFSRILKYGALLARGKMPSAEDKARALAGVNPYFYKEYDAAVRNYPLKKAMAVMSLLCEYDYLGKGGDGTAASADQLLMELIAKILNI